MERYISVSWCYPKGTALPLQAANSSYDKFRFCGTHDPNRARTFIKFVSIVAHRGASHARALHDEAHLIKA